MKTLGDRLREVLMVTSLLRYLLIDVKSQADLPKKQISLDSAMIRLRSVTSSARSSAPSIPDRISS